MISVCELRIGNLVEYNGVIWNVSEIRSPKPLKYKRYSDKHVIELFDGAGLISVPIENVNPIKSTEEWLIKFEFEKEEKIQFYQGYNKGNFHVFEDDGCFYYCADWWIKLKYIHLLQNIFFTLTEKELTLKSNS